MKVSAVLHELHSVLAANLGFLVFEHKENLQLKTAR